MKKIRDIKKVSLPSFEFDLKMKLTTLFLFSILFGMYANESYSQKTKISLDFENATIREIIDQIEFSTDFRFIYATRDIDLNREVSVIASQEKIKEILLKMFDGTNTNYKVRGVHVILKKGKRRKKPISTQSAEVEQDPITITGVITDTNGQPLAGASILEKNTSNGAQTDFDGNYTITVASSNSVLHISYLGYKTAEVTVGNRTNINQSLQEDSLNLNEIVVTGYGSELSRDKITGAIAQIGKEEFESQPLFKVDQALQGRIAGVAVTQNSGSPGRGMRIRVRGANSITSGNDPLYVIDGLMGVDINTVNAADIETITVLKDASSLAIYGSRGSNGVVIITTKRSRSDNPVVTLESFLSVESVINTIDVVSGDQFNQIILDSGGTPNGSSNTDWQDAVYRTGIVQNYNLSVGGNFSKVNYYVSGNLVDHEGMVKNSSYKRYAIRTNLDGDISDKLRFNLNLYASREKGHNNNLEGGAGDGFFRVLVNVDPNQPVDFTGVTPNNTRANPLEILNTKEENRFTNNFQGNLGFDWEITEPLTLSVSGGTTVVDRQMKLWLPATGVADVSTASSGRGFQENLSTQFVTKLAYDKDFGDHSLLAEGLFEELNLNSEFFVINSSDFFTTAGGIDNLAIPATNLPRSGVTLDRLIRSFMFRVNYNYKEKYFLTATLRRDASNVFPVHNAATFPSIGAAWNITSEDFMQDQQLFNSIKLRAGWGETGNQNIPSFSSLSSLNTDLQGWLTAGTNNDIEGLSVAAGPPIRLDNPELRWETTTQTNVGLDMALLNNRLGFTFDYYKKETTDLLLDNNVPNVLVGPSIQQQNVGKVENKGFEIGITANPISSEDGLNWDLAFNLSRNKNEVTELFGDTDFILFGEGFRHTLTSRVEIGEPLGTFNGATFLGVDESNGDPIYEEDGSGNVVLRAIGDPNPDYTFGFNNTFTYKNFDLNIFINGSQGNEILNLQKAFSSRGDAWLPYGTHPDLVNAWTSSNTSSNIPANSSGSIRAYASNFVEDGSFIRIKNITLGYNLGESMLESIGLVSAKFYVSMQNVATFTDYSGLDPELSGFRRGGNDFEPATQADNAKGVDWGSFPLPRTFTVGVNLSF
ncbi:TonB-dependent receptor [Tamlana sp. 2201CG12-4]|uniref:SusC/RagA family TonB-linked outer membrane protein n=1 Tax=Tamlana sp. 2201CG12-4 TaxID=3112582 RepID=UPI002DBAC4EA|nr:TonB-dependent receptor [Tamlana sp. 2201CG12-4]MEC3907874.1 TonB-dependent receptor [Tamlana sp. 2201CG12-4]